MDGLTNRGFCRLWHLAAVALSLIGVCAAAARSSDSGDRREIVPDARPPKERLLEFAGLKWHPWRVAFEVDDNRVRTLPRPRPGFNYGHSGHGRDAILATHIGDESWTDYQVELDFHMLPVDPTFRPFHIPAGTARGFYLFFRVQDMHESWNEPGTRAYQMAFNENGNWGLISWDNLYFEGSIGRGPNSPDSSRVFAKGRSQGIHRDEPNHLRIRVEGRQMRAWLNGELLVEFTDDAPPFPAAAHDYGGIALSWRYESMGWAENLRVTHLD